MASFINLHLGEYQNKTHIKRHLSYSLLWIINISIFLFRVDSHLLSNANLSNDLISDLLILSVIAMNFALLAKQKWYYNIAFVFYPLLLILWFIPKLILETGKVYIFLYYLAAILHFFMSFKKSIFKAFVLGFIILLLVLTNSQLVRIIAIIYFSYLFLKILFNYAKSSFAKGGPVKKKSDKSGIDLIQGLEKAKDDEKLTPEQNKAKRLEQLILWNYFFQYLSDNINGARGKRAFLNLWLLQYFLYFILDIIAKNSW